MGKYVLKRILLMIPILLGVAILIFTMMYFCPESLRNHSGSIRHGNAG